VFEYVWPDTGPTRMLKDFMRSELHIAKI